MSMISIMSSDIKNMSLEELQHELEIAYTYSGRYTDSNENNIKMLEDEINKRK